MKLDINTLITQAYHISRCSSWKLSSKARIADSNYLRCQALPTALHFPLETTWSCKQNRKERYWGQQFWQMERDISVRPTETSKLVPNIPVGQNRNGPFHLMYQPKFPKFWGEWKAPLQLTKLLTWSNRDEDWKNANSFFQRSFCFLRRPRILTSLKLSTRTWLCVLHTVLGQCAKKVSDDLRGKIYL